MELLTPLFAALGAAAASIPVVLHMLRRAPTREMPFSLVRFLKASQPKLTKRANIEHWPLMLLRILALLLIGLAFARPFVRHPAAAQDADRADQAVTILVDCSASMRRDGLQEQVRNTIQEVIAELNDTDLLRVVAFSRTSQQLLSARDWAAATAGEREIQIAEVLENCTPTWMDTHTGEALLLAAEELASQNKERMAVARRSVVLITDFQRGSDLKELKSGTWPASVDVRLRAVETKNRGNVGISLVDDRRFGRTRVRVVSAADTPRRKCALHILDQQGDLIGEPVVADAIPGQRRSLILPAVDVGDRAMASVRLHGDDHDFDNTIALPDMDNPTVRVAHVGPATRNDPESMRYYLHRVLLGNSERDINLIDLQRDDGVVLPIPPDVQFAVATDAVPSELADSLTEFFARSGTLLAAIPSTDAVESLQAFIPAGVRTTEASVGDYGMFGSIDFDHPLFSAFSDARFADFSTIRFWHYRDLSLADVAEARDDYSVVAKFDSGSPAIVEFRVGESGRILLLATGWQPADSQLALSTRFAPLLTRALEIARPAETDQLLRTVGDSIRPGELVSSTDWKVVLPDGSTVTARGLIASEGTASDPLSGPVTLTMPGRYTVAATTPDGDPVSVTLIAGLSPSESRTETLPVGQLASLGIGVHADDSGAASGDIRESDPVSGNPGATELEDRQKWWRWLLLGGLACLLVESLWSSAIAGRALVEV